MRSLILLMLLSLPGSLLQAQQLSLPDLQAAARSHSPLLQQQALQQQYHQQQQEILGRQWFPSLGINAQTTYQSDVITFPEIGNLTFPELPQFQYRATLDLQQTLYEGGLVAQQQLLSGLSDQQARQQLEVGLHQVQRGVTQLYFGILEAEQQIASLQSSLDYLRARRGSLRAAVTNGVKLPADLAAYDQEMLRMQQQIRQVQGQAEGLRAALAVQTGQPEVNTQPLALPNLIDDPTGNRPEYQLFELQAQGLDAQSELLQRQQRPRAAAFASAGVGQPNPYNFLQNEFDGFYLVGLRLSWSPWDWGKTQRQQQQLLVQQQLLEQQEAQFSLQTTAEVARYDAQIRSVEQLLADDERLIELQTQVLRQAEAQLDNGTRTVTEYLAEVQSMTRVQLARELHQLQLRRLHIDRQEALGQH